MSTLGFCGLKEDDRNKDHHWWGAHHVPGKMYDHTNLLSLGRQWWLHGQAELVSQLYHILTIAFRTGFCLFILWTCVLIWRIHTRENIITSEGHCDDYKTQYYKIIIMVIIRSNVQYLAYNLCLANGSYSFHCSWFPPQLYLLWYSQLPLQVNK